jgi:Tfp pilus assembly protein PilP
VEKGDRTMKTKILIVFLIVIFAVSGADAQQKKKKPQKKKDETAAAAAAAQDEASVEEAETGGDFVYKPKGRRDPFWDLLKGKSVKIKREAKEGIAGLLIDELELEGILFKQGKYIALFKGPDGRPYDVKVGDSVYDGEIIKIDVNTVVFKRILTIALGGTKEKIITKRLTPEEEASKQ